jgi:hypothetical protein
MNIGNYKLLSTNITNYRSKLKKIYYPLLIKIVNYNLNY